MKHIFLLSGDFIELAKKEILSLIDVKRCILLNMLLIVELKGNGKLNNKIMKRLALTKNIYKLLYECKINELTAVMKDYGWGSLYKHDFCLRVHYFNNKSNTFNKKLNKKNKTTSERISDGSKPFVLPSEKDLARYIWRSVKKPKVNLENPKTKIEMFVIKNKVYCGLLIFENKEDFESRKSHLRPFPSPSSLHPKLARALVNITGIKENEILLDPFCGTGGFLIEAGLMGMKIIGYDIYKITAEGCKKNLDYYKIGEYKIKNQNALEIHDNFDCIVTDLPYGLNSNALLKYEGNWKEHRLNKKIQKNGFIKNLEQFYLEFLKNLRKRLKNRAVIVFPNYVNYKRLLKKSKFRIEKEFSNYVHRSLTRKIVLLKNQ